jgi:hypothetical protein
MKTTLKVNPSFKNKMKQIEERAEEAIKEELTSIAQTAVNLSPVDTGAYVTSFSYSVGSGRPRGKFSAGKPRGQNPTAMREEGFNNLTSDIARIPNLMDTTSIVLRNNSPHARVVEDKHGYSVFTKLRNLYG